MGMFNKEARADRHEASVQRVEERADDKVDQALRNLRSRRAWIVKKMAFTSGKISGQAFNDDLSKAAQELYYLDSAIRSLSANPPE